MDQSKQASCVKDPMVLDLRIVRNELDKDQRLRFRQSLSDRGTTILRLRDEGESDIHAGI